MATQLHTSTRQQLDELDALLQKMLDQPGKPADPAARPSYNTQGGGNSTPAATEYPPAVAYGLPPTAAFSAETPTNAAAAVKPMPANWSIDLNPRDGSSVLGERSPLAEKLAPFLDGYAPTSATLQVSPVAGEAVQTVRHQPPARHLNYGGVTALPSVRDFLGYAGLAMLAASLTWLMLIWTGWF